MCEIKVHRKCSRVKLWVGDTEKLWIKRKIRDFLQENNPMVKANECAKRIQKQG